MNDPLQPRVNVPVLLIVIAAHAAAIYWALLPPLAPPRGLAPPPGKPAPTLTTNPPGWDTPPTRRVAGAQPPLSATIDAATNDPRREFSAAQISANQRRAQQRAAQRDQREAQVEPDATYAQAIVNLQHRLRDGDDQARVAVARRDAQCEALNASAQGQMPGTDPLRAGSNLSAPDRALLTAAISTQAEQLQPTQQSCRAWDQAKPTMREALHAYAQGDSTLARLARIELAMREQEPTPAARAQWLNELRDLWRADPQPAVAELLARQLWMSGDQDDAKLARSVWMDMARRDDRHAFDFATALPDIPVDPDVERNYEISAALGNPAALSLRIDAADQRGEATVAWSWTAYRVWLTAHGCYAASPDRSADWLATDLTSLARHDGLMNASQREEAGLRYRQRVEQYGARALALSDCGE